MKEGRKALIKRAATISSALLFALPSNLQAQEQLKYIPRQDAVAVGISASSRSDIARNNPSGIDNYLIPPMSSRKSLDLAFLASSMALVASTIYDNETTINCLKNPLLYESNSMRSALAINGRPALYAYDILFDGLLLSASYSMRQSKNNFVRNWAWLIVPAIETFRKTLAGMNNEKQLYRARHTLTITILR